MLRTLSIIFILISFLGAAQDNHTEYEPIIHPITKEPFKEGVFLTFEEFKSNRPTKEFKLAVDDKLNMERRSQSEKRKGLPVTDRSGNIHYLREGDLMAYCDGQYVYISLKTGLYRVEDFGTAYCIFSNDYNAGKNYYMTSTTTPNVSRPTTTTTIHSSGAATGVSYDYILDMRTGEIHSLNRNVLKKIVLPEFPELLTKFEADKMKGVMMRWYVNEFNRLFAGEPEE